MYFISRRNEPNAYFAAFVRSILAVSTVIQEAGSQVSAVHGSTGYVCCVNIMNSIKMDMNCTPQLQYQQRTSK